MENNNKISYVRFWKKLIIHLYTNYHHTMWNLVEWTETSGMEQNGPKFRTK